jgi:hypothetical protein
MLNKLPTLPPNLPLTTTQLEQLLRITPLYKVFKLGLDPHGYPH